jgi:hypothetical protein
LRFEADHVRKASWLEGQADMCLIKAYKEKNDHRLRVSLLKKAAELYRESADLYSKGSMSMFSKGIKNKTEDIMAAVEYELKNDECQDNYKLKCVLLRILRKREFRRKI